MNDTTSGADLAAKKLPELQALAAERGIKGARRLRKGELIEAIRGGGTPPTAAPTDASSAPSAPSASSAQDAPVAQDDAGTAATGRAERSRSRSRSRAASTSDGTGDDPAPELGIELPTGGGAGEERDE
ncbi:MAG: Rho termination factor N-terminal domain-containing protein, partial [Brachybacterium sp.]|nr:Rho termination factor N-terminal domain-containing protein [Brachybacterium sp.]